MHHAFSSLKILLSLLLLFLPIVGVSQVNIKERVEINPKLANKQSGAGSQHTQIGDNNTGPYVVSIVAQMHYTVGQVLSIDPTPVYPAYPIGGQSSNDRFVLLGGNNDAYIRTSWTYDYNSHQYITTGVYLIGGGSGYTVGEYQTWDVDGAGETDIVVRVTNVSLDINPCVTVVPEKTTLNAGERISISFGGGFPTDQLFDVQVQGGWTDNGTLISGDGSSSGVYLTAVPQPITYVAPWVFYSGGIAAKRVGRDDSAASAAKTPTNVNTKFGNSKSTKNIGSAPTPKTQDVGGDCVATDITVSTPPMHFVVTITPDTIVYNASAFVSAHLVDDNGNEIPIDENTQITVTAAPDNFGEINWPRNTISYGELKTNVLTYLADGDEPTVPEEITIDVNGVGKSGSGRLVVKTTEQLDHFKVTLEKDTVAFTETSKIYVQAKDANDADIELDANKLLRLTVATNEEYGTFIDKNGDTLKTTPVMLENIPYGDLKAGLYRFAAVKKNPDSVVVCRIACVLQDDTVKMGLGSVIVKRKLVLKFAERAPWSMWPLLPPTDLKESRGADRAGYRPKRKFTLLLTNGTGTGLSNQVVRIKTSFETKSGGHNHTGKKDADTLLPQEKQGLFFVGGKGQNPQELTTDKKGMAVVDSFVAPEASGKFLVSAYLRADTSCYDTLQMKMEVPDLVDFGTGTYWSLTGTASDTGKNHLSNHWCTRTMKDSLSAAIKDFHDFMLSDKGEGKEIKLGINDLCLELGGIFDLGGRWDLYGPHTFHRVGCSVDIDNIGVDLKENDPNNPGKKRLTDRGKQLEKSFQKFGGKMYDEGPIHFGFDKGI